MKTFAHLNALGDVVGIGIIYLESGGLTPPVAEWVKTLGEDAGIKAYGDTVRADLSMTTVVIDTAQMPGDDPNTYDKTFRDAYKYSGGLKVDVDVPKAKLIAHDMRRAKRQQELAPLDVEATIPSKAVAAEAKRQIIRDAYAVIQTSIDAATDATALKVIIAAVKSRA